jgi:UDP-N-acetyl-D-galactosamine dehydrogenase
VSVHDPLAAPDEAKHEYGIGLKGWDELPRDADAVVAAVSHKHYLGMPLEEILGRLRQGGLFVDVKCAYDPHKIRAAGKELWRL